MELKLISLCFISDYSLIILISYPFPLYIYLAQKRTNSDNKIYINICTVYLKYILYRSTNSAVFYAIQVMSLPSPSLLCNTNN